MARPRPVLLRLTIRGLLGRLVALRFIEWAQRSPGGVCALPTGRTPEHFINWTKKLLEGWEEPGTRELLEEGGVDVRKGKPDMASLRFVQLDDFYPMHPSHPNRFTNYVRALYVDALGMDQAKAMLMDDLWTMGCDEGTNAGELFEAYFPGRNDVHRLLMEPISYANGSDLSDPAISYEHCD